MLQSPDLPLDEETTSFTDIPRGEFSYLQNSNISPGAKGLKWRFFGHESEQAEFGLKL